MSKNPIDKVKDTVYAAASTSGEWAQQNVVDPIRSYVAGDKSAGSDRVDTDIPDEECENIERMEKEKVAEFLREKHKSNAGAKRR
ncbi:hypothetical protein BDW62DRAFT_205554 [Aspergillus aurantiobrunneus]